MGQAQINVRTRACSSRTSIARTKQAALTHNVRGKELIERMVCDSSFHARILYLKVSECGLLLFALKKKSKCPENVADKLDVEKDKQEHKQQN